MARNILANLVVHASLSSGVGCVGCDSSEASAMRRSSVVILSTRVMAIIELRRRLGTWPCGTCTAGFVEIYSGV